MLSAVRAIDVTRKRHERLARVVLAALAIGLFGGCGRPYGTPLARCANQKAFRPPECALPRLLETLSDRDAWDLELAYASDAIAHSEEKSPETLARLRALLREELKVDPPAMPPRGPRPKTRAEYVIMAINGFGASASAARDELREAYRSRSSRVAWAGFWGLAELADDEVLPGLISLLISREGGHRRTEVKVLPRYGPREKAAIPVLLQLLEQGDPDGAGLLGLIGDPVAIDPLARALRIENYHFRATVLEALAGFGPAAASAVPAIQSMTDNWAPIVRARAWAALHAIVGGEPSVSTPRLPPTCLGPFPAECVTESGTVQLTAVQPYVPDECAEGAKAALSRLGVLFGRSCILSVDYGEWGSWLIDADRVSGKTQRFHGNANQFVMLRGHLLALGHQIQEIDRAPDGSLKLEEIAVGPGRLTAYGLDANGDLVFVAHGNGALEPSAPNWPSYEYGPWLDYGTALGRDIPFVLRLDRAGQLVEVH